MAITKNFGQVVGLIKGISPPTITSVLWFDTSEAIAVDALKIFDDNTTSWIRLVDAVNAVANGTDLSFSLSAVAVTIESSTGANTTVPQATPAQAGVQSAADKSKLDEEPDLSAPVDRETPIEFEHSETENTATSNPEARSPNLEPIRIADIGTGSGIIAITLLKHLPHATVVATDLSEDALAVARTNAETHGVFDRVDFRHGDGLAPLRNDTEPLDALLSNPPYIPDAEWPDVPADVKEHEPTLALRGGSDGLDVLRPLIADGRELVKPGGFMAFEIAAVQADAVRQLAADAGWSGIDVLPDHERLPRVLVGAT